MNYAGCKRKFKVLQFVTKYSSTPPAKEVVVATAKRATSKKAKSKSLTGNKKKLLEHLAKRKTSLPPDTKIQAKKCKK
jgi:hypothetical protein